MAKELIAKTSDVPEGSYKDFTYQGQPAILVHFDGEFHAFVNICTHEGGLCVLSGGVLLCTVHASTFDPKTGHTLSEPAPLDSSLKRIPIRIENGQVLTT